MMRVGDVTFGNASGLSYAVIAQALLHCYDNFEERMAALAKAQGEPWEEPADGMVSAEDVAEVVEVHDVDLSLSVVGYDQDAVVAIALLGQRGPHGWLADFAVARSHRGRGLGHALLHQYLASARAAGIREVSFDVLVVNTPAIRTYERAGFRVACKQHELLASSDELGWVESVPGQVSPVDASRLTGWYDRIIGEGEPEPCWERRLPSLLAADAEVIAYPSIGAARALLAFKVEDNGIERKVALMFAGFAGDAGVSELRAVLRAAGGPGRASFRAGLEPAHSRFADLLRQAGFRLGRRSLEMRMALAKHPPPEPAS